VKPIWILLQQDMMGWQWHQLDHKQIICTSLQTDNHAITLSLNFLQAGCSSRRPTNNVKALKAINTETDYFLKNFLLATTSFTHIQAFQLNVHRPTAELAELTMSKTTATNKLVPCRTDG